MNHNIDQEIISYCNYCLEPIYEGSDYVVIHYKKHNYHFECYKLINNTLDSQELKEENEE